jgi:hypothetical protein
MPWRLLVLFLAAVLQPACLQLPDYDETGCGDSILGAGEDCDGRYAIDGATCGAPGDEHACHYVCTSDAACPDGWGCGADGRCYQPQLVLAPPPAPKPLPMRVSDVTDVDGDGFGDLVGNAGVTITTRFGDVSGALDESFDLSIPPPTGKVWFAPLDGDGQSDAIIPLGATLVVLSGQETRDFASRLFPTLRLPLDVREATGAALEGDRDLQDPARAPLDLDSELLLLTQSERPEGPQSTMTFVGSSCGEVPVPLPGGRQVADLGGRPSAQNPLASGTRIPRADLDGDGFTELALAFRGSPTLHLYGSAGSPDSPDPASCLRPVPYSPTPEISMPAGYALGDQNALFVDVDGDTDLDVLMGITAIEPPATPPDLPPLAAIAVAHALGDGTYEAEAAPLLDLTPFPAEQRLLYAPLAAGDLDGAGGLEYVTPGGILQIGPDLAPVILAAPSAGAWVAAEVLDVNDDGALDVVAASSGGIDWFLNAGPIGLPGHFNRFILDTVFLSPQLRSGDFNGDLLPDIAVAGRIDEDQNALTVVFSTSTGAPSEVQSIGRFGDRFHFMDTALIPALGGRSIDGVSDVTLWTSNDSLDPMRPPEAAFYAVQGSTSQRLLSPFFVVGDPRQPLEQQASMVIAAAGAFAGAAFELPGNPRSIAVVSRPVAVSDPETETSGLTLLVPRAFGELRPTQPAPALLVPLSRFQVDCALWLAGDVEQGDDFGPDELIGVEQGVSCEGFTARPALAVLVLSVPTPEAPPVLAVIDLPDRYDRVTSARLADVDANQSLDLVLVLGKKDAAQADVMILWNDDSCPTSRFCESSATLVPASPSLVPTDVVAMQLQGDARRELVVLSDSLGDGPARSSVEVFAASADDARNYQSTVTSLATPPNRLITYLAAGDINGDGLEDLVLGGAILADVLIQTPAEPLGTAQTRQAAEETP